MVDKKKVMSDLDQVGQLLEATRKSGKKLTTAQVKQAKETLGAAASELFRLKARNVAASTAYETKRQAIAKSASENLITEGDSKAELRMVATASFATNARAKRIQQSIEAVKRLASEVNKLASSESEQLYKEDKGHASDADIKPPEKLKNIPVKDYHVTGKAKRIESAVKVAEAPENGDNPKIVHDDGKVPVNRPPVKGLAPEAPGDPIGTGNIVEKEEGVPLPNTQQGNTEIDPKIEPPVIAAKARASQLYTRAMALVKAASAEVDPAVRAKKQRMATTLERMADRLISGKPKTASVKQAATASTTVLAANDRVLLADGSIGTVSAINGDKLQVSVAGVSKDVLTSTVKRISTVKRAEQQVNVKADEKMVTIKVPTELVEEAVEKIEEKEAAPKAEGKPQQPPKMEPKESKEPPKEMPMKEVGSSIADRVRAGIAMVRGGKKVAAEPAPAPAMAEKSSVEPVKAPAGDKGTVGKSYTMTYAPAANGKFNVQISDTEIVECDTEEEAKQLIARGSKVRATTRNVDAPTDSSTLKKPDSSAPIYKTLRGLDQQGKDYGTTTAEEVVDPQLSMLVKKGTTRNPDAPTDSSTLREPDSAAAGQKTLRGLDQKGKDYGTTSKEEKVDPQFSMLKHSDLEIKAKILADSNRKQSERLSVVEAELLTDRAVKVGAITEEQRSEQQTVLAELYKQSPAEFKAFGRLIASLETQKGQPSLANRQVRRVEAAISRRNSEVVDGQRSTTASLEDGTFFDEE